MNRLKENGAKAGTIRNVTYAVSGVLRYAMRDGRVVRNVVAEIDELPASMREEVVPLELEQVESIAKEVATRPGHRNRPETQHPEFGVLVRFAALSGLRAGEIRGLRVGRLDLMRGVVQVARTVVDVRSGVVLDDEPTKTRQTRLVPIPRWFCDELATYLGDRAKDKTAFVFPDPERGGPLRWTWFYNQHYVPAVKRTGLTGVTFHNLRHTYASQMARQGETIHTVSRLLGHSSIAVTERVYAHLFPHVLESAADRLGDRYRAAMEVPTQSAAVHDLRATATP